MIMLPNFINLRTTQFWKCGAIYVIPVRANYRIQYGTGYGTSVPDPIHPIP